MIVTAIVRTYEEDEFAVHKVPLMMMGGIVALSLALTAGVSFGFFDRQAVPAEIRAADGVKMVTSRPIQFFDEENGTVRVEDAITGEVLASYGPGTGGFIRSTGRSLAHERRIRGIGRETPFDLIEWDNGALTLQDSTTGKTVELAFFGDNNRKFFADMLPRETK